VWNESSTYLHRLPKPKTAANPSPESPSPSGEGQIGGLRPTAIWRIPSDIGRRYAAVSGDVNPIHLNPLAARLFGFKRAIAHGMWLKARCLAAFEGRLPDWLPVDVEFKSPLLLPSTVAFSSGQDSRGWLFAVNHASSGRPHLIGRTSGV
jgi:acyl dehydratase